MPARARRNPLEGLADHVEAVKEIIQVLRDHSLIGPGRYVTKRAKRANGPLQRDLKDLIREQEETLSD